MFCVKRRRKELTDAITVELFREAVSKYPIEIAVGEVGEQDHIHLMIQAPATFAPSYIAKIVKGCSSKIIGKHLTKWSGWSRSYFISTTGGTATDAVKAYIENQKND